jgi:hypothetical protein
MVFVLFLALDDLVDCFRAQRSWSPSPWDFLEGALYPSSRTSIARWKLGTFDLPDSAPIAGPSGDFPVGNRLLCRHGGSLLAWRPMIQPL